MGDFDWGDAHTKMAQKVEQRKEIRAHAAPALVPAALSCCELADLWHSEAETWSVESDERAAWLRDRYDFDPDNPMGGEWYIGATGLSALLGVNKYETPLTLYHTYMTPESRQAASEQMLRGIVLEESVARMFSAKYGWPIRKAGMLRHREHYHIGVNLDYETFHPDYQMWVPLETKTHSFFVKDEYGEQDTDAVQDHEVVQCVIQSDFIGAPVTVLASAFGLDFKELHRYFVPADKAVANAAVQAGVDFINNNLASGIPPAITGFDADVDLLKRLNDGYVPPVVKQATDEINVLVRKLVIIDKESKTADLELNRIKNELKNYIGTDADTLMTCLGKIPYQANKNGVRSLKTAGILKG